MGDWQSKDNRSCGSLIEQNLHTEMKQVTYATQCMICDHSCTTMRQITRWFEGGKEPYLLHRCVHPCVLWSTWQCLPSVLASSDTQRQPDTDKQAPWTHVHRTWDRSVHIINNGTATYHYLDPYTNTLYHMPYINGILYWALRDAEKQVHKFICRPYWKKYTRW